METGTVAEADELWILTNPPPAGAGFTSVTVAFEVPPPATDVGLSEILLISTFENLEPIA